MLVIVAIPVTVLLLLLPALALQMVLRVFARPSDRSAFSGKREGSPLALRSARRQRATS